MSPRGCAAADDDDARLRLTRDVRQGTRTIRAGAWATTYMEGGAGWLPDGRERVWEAKADDDAHVVALAAYDDTAPRFGVDTVRRSHLRAGCARYAQAGWLRGLGVG